MENEELFIKKGRFRFLKYILFILLIALICGGAYYYYTNRIANPSHIIISSLEKLNSQISDKKTSDVFKLNGLFTIKLDLGNEDKEIADIINNLSLQFKGEFDTKYKISNIDIDSKYKNDKLLKGNFYIENNDIYVYSSDIYDKYIKIDGEEFNLNNEKMNNLKTITIDDEKIIINALVYAFNNSFDKDKIKTLSDNITINNKNYDVNNNYINLTNKDLQSFFNKFYDNLYENIDFMTVYKKIDETGNLKEFFERLNDQLENSHLTYKINFYTTKSFFNQKLISIKFDMQENDDIASIITNFIDDYELIVQVDDFAYLKVNISPSVININAKFNDKDYKIEFNANFNYEEISTITKPDVSNNINMDKLTIDDQDKMKEKLEKNENLSKFINDISKIIQKSSLTTE